VDRAGWNETTTEISRMRLFQRISLWIVHEWQIRTGYISHQLPVTIFPVACTINILQS